MSRVLIFLVGLALGLGSLGGVALAQETIPASTTTADGGYSVADESNPVVSDEGVNRVHGDIQTGGGGGEILGDPAALVHALGQLQSHDDITNSVPPPNLTPWNDPDPAPLPAPAPAPVDDTTVTTAETTASDGDTSASGEPVPAPVEETAAAPPADSAAAPAGCGSYASWYDAQVALESSADPALTQALDPDGNGVACEELITY